MSRVCGLIVLFKIMKVNLTAITHDSGLLNLEIGILYRPRTSMELR